MEEKKLNYYYNKLKFGEDIFYNLMRNRVKEILLISTFYDAFIFEQDGRLSEQIFGDYRQLNLSTAPRITTVPTGADALNALEEKEFDLVITMLRIGEISAFELSKQIKEKDPNLPILLLLNVRPDIKLIERYDEEMQFIEEIFLWSGDAKLFLAMVKSVEDKRNVEYDTKHGLVRIILLVEDNVHYYSMFLPLLYAEIMKQTQLLIQEELSDINKRLRMRARPKVILVHNFEEAYEIYEKYKEYIISIISDVGFLHNRKIDSEAGIKLISKIREDSSDIPVILQSTDLKNKEKARMLGVTFLHKESKNLLHKLHDFIINNLGFGDFIFRNAEGLEISRATSMVEFEETLKEIPITSIIYHSIRNDFSTWLLAHSEIQIAKKIRPIKVKDFSTAEELREHLLSTFKTVRINRNRGKIIDFEPSSLTENSQITRLSEGSLGGKGRGLAFLNALLVSMEFDKRYPEVDICMPYTAIIGTNEYDYFIESNHLDEDILEKDDHEIDQMFQNGKLSQNLIDKLHIYIDHIHHPIAVRSSGLMEDSQFRATAGVYRTYMLPNNHPDKDVRVIQLMNAIKLVFASVFIEKARKYIESMQYKLEEEKMAVVIQHIAGAYFGKNFYYYPHFSGVAQSYNFYPTSCMKHSDATAALAVGLGRWIIEGEKSFRFCPHYPKIEAIPTKDLISSSQKEFYALNMENIEFDLTKGEEVTLAKLDIKDAEEHKTLEHLASVWDYQDNRMVSDLSRKGPRVVTFDKILKYNYLPLANILEEILKIGEEAFGVPIEIEFASTLGKGSKNDKHPTFYLLQIRPLSISTEDVDLDPDTVNKEKLFIYTEKGMGNGVITDIKDIIFLDPDKFDNTKTMDMLIEIESLNSKMMKQNLEYILIGPGRWGSRDRFLGVPVKWIQICNAKVIVETGLEGLGIDPSQGTHFFHNLISMNVGYFAIPYNSNTDFIDWNWLRSQNVIEETKYFSHIRIDHPLITKMDGKSGIAIIYK